MSDEPISGIADDPAPEGIADDPAPAEGDKPEGIAEDAKPEGGETPKEEPKPEDYTLEAGENFPMPEDNLKSFTDTCKKAGLTKAQAEAVLGWHRNQYGSYNADVQAQQQQTLKSWNTEIQGDKEFGGTNMKATVADARRALNTFDEDGSLRALLRDSQYQHNPTVIRAIARIGRAMREDSLAKASGEGSVSTAPLWDRMYDSNRK